MIEDARKLLKPTEVKLHQAPKWFLNALNAYAKKNGIRDTSKETIVLEVLSRASWLDHWGKTRWNGEDVFVSEPYGFCNRDASQLNHLCTEVMPGARWEVCANSWWNPGQTVRIVVRSK